MGFGGLEALTISRVQGADIRLLGVKNAGVNYKELLKNQEGSSVFKNTTRFRKSSTIVR